MYFYKFLLYLVWSELVRVVERSELQTWYKKVMKDDAASAYVLRPLKLPSSQLRGVGLEGLRQTRERLKLVEESKSIFELTKYMKVLQIIYSRLWQGPGMSELQVSVKLSAAE
jgi:hypothetical protein